MRNQAESTQNSTPGVIPCASWRVIEVHTLTGYHLAVRFVDGTTGEVDLSRLVMSDMEAIVKQKIKLDPLEEEIEAQVDKFVSITGEKRRRIEAIIESSRKSKNINIRISEYDLAHLKRKAEEEGMPYQTLISSVLHKYITNRLIDEKEVLKSLKLLEKR